VVAIDAALDMSRYSTQEVAQATGIPVTTILAWERRYGVPRPERSEGGRRQYSQADLALLRAMRERTADGVRAEVAARELLHTGSDPCGVSPQMLTQVRTEVQEIRCLLCGETSGELLTQRACDGTHTRFVLTPGIVPPHRGPTGRPRCGRCGGDLYREPADSRCMLPFVPAAGVASGRDAA
jgi:DNA-binding transcriptional MerR regulator